MMSLNDHGGIVKCTESRCSDVKLGNFIDKTHIGIIIANAVNILRIELIQKTRTYSTVFREFIKRCRKEHLLEFFTL